MTLQNLLAIQRLQTHDADAASVRKLMETAKRNLADAQIAQLSPDNRFDAAYKCILQCAMLGLWGRGYRTSTSQPGHHQTAIQTLGLTMGVPQQTVVVLDALRRQRNATDYAGDPVSPAALSSCLKEAARLLTHTEDWLQRQRPDWLEGA
jgi:hypothetical protein